MTLKSSYRQKPNNICYICQRKIDLSFYKREGFDLDILEDVWTRLGAKVCLGEINMNIIPLNKPNEMPDYGDSLILLQLANRIKGVINFEAHNRHRDGYETQFHPSVFKDKE